MQCLRCLAAPAIALIPRPTVRLMAGLTLGLPVAVLGLFWPHVAEAKPALSPAEDRLGNMFSPDIQAMSKACEHQQGVNLAAGADKDGSVICGNGWRKSPVKYTAYLDFATHLLSASFLVGLKAGLQENPDFKPEAAATLFNSPEVIKSLREAVRAGILSSDMLTKGSTQSVTLLTDRVMQQTTPFLRDPARLNDLFGTKEEYSRIAQNFCTPPGMPFAQALRLAPKLLPAQIYAICLQEAGLVEEFKQSAPQRSQ